MSTDFPELFEDDDSIDINLRSVDEVIRRTVLLITMLRRAALEEPEPNIIDAGAFERETDRFELYSWAKTELASVWSEEDQAVLRTPVDELSEAQLDQCLDAASSATALCWALGVVDRLQLYDDEASIERLLAWAPTPWNGLVSLVRKSSLRSEADIAAELERWELLWWRLSVGPGDFDSPLDMRNVIRQTAEEARAAGLIEMVAHDFAIGDQPVSSLASDHLAQLKDVSWSYLRALTWVSGYESA